MNIIIPTFMNDNYYNINCIVFCLETFKTFYAVYTHYIILKKVKKISIMYTKQSSNIRRYLHKFKRSKRER